MSANFKIAAVALGVTLLASCGGGGGESAFADDPLFNQTSLAAPSSIYPGSSGPASFELASVYQNGSLVVGSKNVFYSAGPNDRAFTINLTFNESNLTSGSFTGSGTSTPVNNNIQVTSLNFDGSTRNFCVNIRGDAVQQPRAYAVFGSNVVNLATLGTNEHFCSDIGVAQDGSRFIVSKPTASSVASTPGTVGTPSIYRAAVNSNIFSLFWSGLNKYQATVDDPNNPGTPIIEARNLTVSGISIAGDTINWTGTYRANDGVDSQLGVDDATFLYEDSASSLALPINGTRLTVNNLGEGDLFFAEEIISVSNGSEIFMLADQEEGTQTFNGLVVLQRGNPIQITPVATGADCLGTFALRNIQQRQYACFKSSGGFLTTLLLN